jgi:hypothetical protein
MSSTAITWTVKESDPDRPAVEAVELVANHADVVAILVRTTAYAKRPAWIATGPNAVAIYGTARDEESNGQALIEVEGIPGDPSRWRMAVAPGRYAVDVVFIRVDARL